MLRRGKERKWEDLESSRSMYVWMDRWMDELYLARILRA